MTDEDFSRRFAQDRIQSYLKIRDKAAERLARIERDGWQYFQARGTESMTDVTQELADCDRELIAMMERLMELYEGDLGK